MTDRPFELDRKIPVSWVVGGALAAVVAIGGWAAAGASWFARNDIRVELLEKNYLALSGLQTSLAERVTRTEGHAAAVQRDVAEIKSDVKQLIFRREGRAPL
jgi:hypothetical protein